jgi:LysR family glycine cleavage system transcriptional activator/LysR family transcriptional regulator of beta-lactamase
VPCPNASGTTASNVTEYRPVRGEDPALLAFRDWLRGEADRQRQIEAELIERPVKPASRKRKADA